MEGCSFDGARLSENQRDSPSISAIPPCSVAWIKVSDTKFLWLYDGVSSIPKQPIKYRSILKDLARFLGLCWKKKPSNGQITFLVSFKVKRSCLVAK